jgi:hypothetical protein
VTLEGFTPIMFDRYPGDNKTQLPVGEKMYFIPGTRQLCIPSVNISSFLSAKNTTSVAKMIGGRGYKSLADAFLSFVQIAPFYIPLMRNDAPIVFNGFTDGVDEAADIFVHYGVARLIGGIPNPKERPVVNLPWELTFTVSLFKNKEVDETMLRTAFSQGGISLGLGTYRGQFGKFLIKSWNMVD